MHDTKIYCYQCIKLRRKNDIKIHKQHLTSITKSKKHDNNQDKQNTTPNINCYLIRVQQEQLHLSISKV